MNADLDTAIRLAAFRWRSEVTASHGDMLPRTLLPARIRLPELMCPAGGVQGLFKP